MGAMRQPLKTYAHLAHRRRMPSEYELLSSQLLYQKGSAFEVDVPLASFHAEHRREALRICGDWERFDDPRATTYTRYVELQAKQAAYVSGLFEAIEARDRAQRPSDAWLARLRYLAALRYPLHGLQMITSHLAHLAPSGKVAIALAFQAADEMRRVQSLAYRMAQLRLLDPTFGDDGRALWQSDPALQPLRELVERMLVRYDFVQGTIALSLVVKPLFDGLVHTDLPNTAEQAGDPLLAELLRAHASDARWHLDVGRALARLMVHEGVVGGDELLERVSDLRALAERATTSLAIVLLGLDDHEASRVVLLHVPPSPFASVP